MRVLRARRSAGILRARARAVKGAVLIRAHSAGWSGSLRLARQGELAAEVVLARRVIGAPLAGDRVFQHGALEPVFVGAGPDPARAFELRPGILEGEALPLLFSLHAAL